MRPKSGTLSAGARSVTLTNPQNNPELAGTSLAELPGWLQAVHAAEEKQAIDMRVLDLREVTSFTDFFLICSATNPRQGQAIADEVGKTLKAAGEKPASVEGYDTGDWILLDYGDFLVHIFSESARKYYDLERLWRHAKLVDLAK